jgi:solute carrier family 25 phosphate transporter 23/24/25/41
MMCGGLAGMIAKTATNPLDRIRMLSQTGEHGVVVNKKPTTLQLYSSIMRNEGILGLWAGNGANLLRVFPSKSIIFSTNDLYRTKLGTLYHGGSYDDWLSSGKYLPWSLSFLCGGLAGMTATSITYPLDLARGRIAGKVVPAEGGGVKHYRGIINTVLVTAREEGALALYKGVSPTLLGAMPYEGIKFGTVAILERAFPRKRRTMREGAEEEVDGKGKDDNNNNNNNNGISVSDVTRKLLFGGAGGVTASVITYPNDTVRRFLQLQGSRGTTEHFDGYW